LYEQPQEEHESLEKFRRVVIGHVVDPTHHSTEEGLLLVLPGDPLFGDGQRTRVVIRRPVKEEEWNHDGVELQSALVVRERQKHQGDEHREMDLKNDVHL
jgi:hypothetical protein